MIKVRTISIYLCLVSLLLFVSCGSNIKSDETYRKQYVAAYQGASALNEVEFHHGNMQIESYAKTGQEGQGSVSTYQSLLTEITTDIVTLEILTHTPIITNTTTDITLDSTIEKSRRQIAKENKAVEKRIRKAAKEDEKLEKKLIKQEEKEKEKAAKEEKKAVDSTK